MFWSNEFFPTASSPFTILDHFTCCQINFVSPVQGYCLLDALMTTIWMSNVDCPSDRLFFDLLPMLVLQVHNDIFIVFGSESIFCFWCSNQFILAFIWICNVSSYRLAGLPVQHLFLDWIQIVIVINVDHVGLLVISRVVDLNRCVLGISRHVCLFHFGNVWSVSCMFWSNEFFPTASSPFTILDHFTCCQINFVSPVQGYCLLDALMTTIWMSNVDCPSDRLFFDLLPMLWYDLILNINYFFNVIQVSIPIRIVYLNFLSWHDLPISSVATLFRCGHSFKTLTRNCCLTPSRFSSY